MFSILYIILLRIHLNLLKMLWRRSVQAGELVFSLDLCTFDLRLVYRYPGTAVLMLLLCPILRMEMLCEFSDRGESMWGSSPDSRRVGSICCMMDVCSARWNPWKTTLRDLCLKWWCHWGGLGKKLVYISWRSLISLVLSFPQLLHFHLHVHTNGSLYCSGSK